jgi:hypothetical protein
MPDVWHRQEPREVRPFFMSVKAEDALQNSRIRLFADGQTSIEPSYELDDIDFKRLALQIEPIVANPKEWLPDGIKTKDLKLVLIGRHSFLKRSDQLFEFAMDSGPVPVWDIEPDLLSRFGGGKNFQITLALCLSADRQWKPGAPFVQGHWISQKTFTLRSRAVPSLFDVRPRNDEDWVRAGFPAKTLFAVEYNGGIEVEPEEDSSVATVHIHADAHNKLVNSPLGASHWRRC